MGCPNLGELGEHITAQWLQGQGYEILASRWRCRWGELDLIAYQSYSQQPLSSPLLFVEVKTRQSSNWDADGLLAISPQKQKKLYRTAEIFLSRHPHLASVGCRFDLALVKARSSCGNRKNPLNAKVELNNPVYCQGYELTLTSYLEAIF
ncbi:MAG: YraN family protein [Cyanobacteria bacterium SW_9_44_58]|nr:MAG: YraN family protein [Cyanobacteria bacterium SW_9_44_58]